MMKNVAFLIKGHIFFFIIYLDLWKIHSIMIMSSGNTRHNVVVVAALLRNMWFMKKKKTGF